MNYKELEKLVRYLCLTQTYYAQSGHLTSSLSAVEIILGLLLSGEFTYDVKSPKNVFNDQLIFSKAHASPLYYSIWYLLNELSIEDLKTFRNINSNLEGHPTNRFKHTVAAAGSLGQGLGIGAGLAFASQRQNINNKIYVLMGDGELNEGSVYETMEWASLQNLNNLVAIVDVNRLDQLGKTNYEWDMRKLESRFKTFGWDTQIIWHGNDTKSCIKAFSKLKRRKPTALLFRTKKGAGISFLEDKLNWHGKALKVDQQKQALNELGPINTELRLSLPTPEQNLALKNFKANIENTDVGITAEMEIRDAYGLQLENLTKQSNNIIVLDAGVSNSTRSDQANTEKFVDMRIAEQNMISVATGLSLAGYNVIASSFSAFLTRSHDQIRMAQYSNVNLTIVGSHAGSSIGEDGSSQMGLEDISMFRSMLNTTIINPSDTVSMAKLLPEVINTEGIKYIRSTRAKTPPIYSPSEEFKIGDFKVPYKNSGDTVAILTSGVTLYTSLQASEILANNGINVRVIDLYTLKPLNKIKLRSELIHIHKIITVEDHFVDGGIGDIINKIFNNDSKVIVNLGVEKMPRSGSSEQVMEFVGIDKKKIIETVVKLHELKMRGIKNA